MEKTRHVILKIKIFQENNFDNIKITLASPENKNLGHMEKLKNQRQLIIELLDQRKTVYFVLEYLVQ